MKNRKGNILDVLNKLSDTSFQQDVWIKHSYWDRVLNIEEAINTLDDYSFFDDVDRIDESGFENLVELSKCLTIIDIPRNLEGFLNSPKWNQVVELSKKALHEVKNNDSIFK